MSETRLVWTSLASSSAFAPPATVAASANADRAGNNVLCEDMGAFLLIGVVRNRRDRTTYLSVPAHHHVAVRDDTRGGPRFYDSRRLNLFREKFAAITNSSPTRVPAV